MTCDYISKPEQAALLAERYGWPSEAATLRRGKIPHNFRSDVARAIVDFKERGPFYYWENSDDDDFHAKQLAKLRIILAEICIANTVGKE